MSGVIDRSRVRAAFGAGASAYDRHAEVQRRVIAALVDSLRGLDAPARLLDVGSGTGNLLREVRGLFPRAALFGIDLAEGMNVKAREALGGDAVLVAGDAEHLPFPDASFDLVVSTSVFQWLESLDTAFSEVRRVLTPGGSFVFAMFGEHTLEELRESYRSALSSRGEGMRDRTHRFFTPEEVRAALDRGGFSSAAVSFRREVVHHPDVPDLLRGLRSIGAGNASPLPRNGLAERGTMVRMMEHYRSRYGCPDGRIPATYGIIQGFGAKTSSGPTR